MKIVIYDTRNWPLVTIVTSVIALSQRRPGVVPTVIIISIVARVATTTAAPAAGAVILALTTLVVNSGIGGSIISLGWVISDRACVQFCSNLVTTQKVSDILICCGGSRDKFFSPGQSFSVLTVISAH